MKSMAEALKEVRGQNLDESLVSKAKEIAKRFKNNMSKAIDEIEKLKKGLSNDPIVKLELQKQNENNEVDEKISNCAFIFCANWYKYI